MNKDFFGYTDTHCGYLEERRTEKTQKQYFLLRFDEDKVGIYARR